MLSAHILSIGLESAYLKVHNWLQRIHTDCSRRGDATLWGARETVCVSDLVCHAVRSLVLFP